MTNVTALENFHLYILLSVCYYIWLKKISKEINKVNLADVDANKYGKYEGIKENFDAIVDSYESNLGNSNKVFDFIEGKVMLFNLIVTLVAFVVLKRRINNV